MREIKFRQYTGKLGMEYFGLDDIGVAEGMVDPMPCVMQYTGLKDKNGVELYEGDLYLHWGDIVRADYHSVIYDNMQYTLLDGDFEIIGNTYENPELLEGDF
ncbi:YopX-like protein [Alteromonas phage vB_AmeM_PT11-V22]|uniref:YopX-like protein n=1 Tax=Alteromonas phage vB_AmeM_PT11-V22 TaxID=2704031 RepID=A0A6C0R0Z2_9CAUD|nr:YopX-like protein [Alteromonas phage vB_AmeM_PT11-V22]QHZ59878.1 YopX-like protein [Alteromonas phage vB_AmeM_PT11-V22]